MGREKEKMPIHVDYRPRNWKELLGNKALVSSLRSVLEGPDASHAYLFCGSYGSGKTTLARLSAKALGITDRNINEVDCAVCTGVEDVRKIVFRSRYAPIVRPGEKKRRCFILDEAHMLSKPNAQSALLKILEEAPEHTFFFLCSTDPQQLLPTVRSRCLTYKVEPLSRVEIADLITFILNEEGASLDDRVLRKICEVSEGIPRDALVMLAQVIDVENVEVALDSITLGIKEVEVIEIAKILIDPLIKDKWSRITKILDRLKKPNYEELRMGIFSYFVTILKSKPNPNVANAVSYFMDELKRPLKANFELCCYLAARD